MELEGATGGTLVNNEVGSTGLARPNPTDAGEVGVQGITQSRLESDPRVGRLQENLAPS